ncbi:host-nuclease inhibitor Gam family protein [Christensenellaceae bacterium OttesenSCG-928-M15]|nr:host-nuclease inhibitor Gam family protein [Christensenellaceae bacterium OttesenSCG-928-M15]
MARVKIPEITLKSWDEVNLCLAEIGECQRAIEAAEADMQATIDDAKLTAGMAAEPYQNRVKALELQIKAYVDNNMDDLGKKKTKQLPFGKTGYRKSTKAVVPRGAAKVAAIVKKLREHNMTDCIVTKPPTINKDALKKYPANEILAVGANIKADDTFWYEVDRESLQEG